MSLTPERIAELRQQKASNKQRRFLELAGVPPAFARSMSHWDAAKTVGLIIEQVKRSGRRQ